MHHIEAACRKRHVLGHLQEKVLENSIICFNLDLVHARKKLKSPNKNLHPLMQALSFLMKIYVKNCDEEYLNRTREEVILKSMEDGQVRATVRGRHFDSAVASPDGRFVFTSQWRPVRAEVWDASTGALLSELPVGANWRGAFSPDGRWLATFSRDCQLWEVGTWRPGPAIPLMGSNQLDTSQGVPAGGGAAFSPDGRLLAVVQDLRQVRLITLPEARVVATLPARDGARLQTLSFSGDGSLLAAATSRGELHLWNLKSLRTRLGELGLDW